MGVTMEGDALDAPSSVKPMLHHKPTSRFGLFCAGQALPFSICLKAMSGPVAGALSSYHIRSPFNYLFITHTKLFCELGHETRALRSIAPQQTVRAPCECAFRLASAATRG